MCVKLVIWRFEKRDKVRRIQVKISETPITSILKSLRFVHLKKARKVRPIP